MGTHTLQTSMGAFALQQLGDVYSQMEQWSDALLAYQDALKIREKSGTVDRKNGVLLKEAMEHAEEQLSVVSTARRFSLANSCVIHSSSEIAANSERPSEGKHSDSIELPLYTKTTTTATNNAGTKSSLDRVRNV